MTIWFRGDEQGSAMGVERWRRMAFGSQGRGSLEIEKRFASKTLN